MGQPRPHGTAARSVARLVVCALASALVAAHAEAPARLSQTGLYEPGTLQVRAVNRAFAPQYPLWSDGAAKRRWLYLPEGSFIDATRPDAWEFPPGTRLWKEFSHGGRPVETRLIERLDDGQWRFSAYVWNEAGADATLAPDEGVAGLQAPRAPGGRYDIPSRADCRACHEGAAVPVLGFSAVQLGARLPELAAGGLVRNLPDAMLERAPRIAARSELERAALGYLHANCGHCHSGTPAAPPVDFTAAQKLADPWAMSRVLRSMLDAPSSFQPDGFGDAPRVVTPGRPATSVLTARMRSRDPQAQMPPLGTRIADDEGVALVERWIHSLQPEISR